MDSTEGDAGIRRRCGDAEVRQGDVGIRRS
jgi:hypothetical protein